MESKARLCMAGGWGGQAGQQGGVAPGGAEAGGDGADEGGAARPAGAPALVRQRLLLGLVGQAAGAHALVCGHEHGAGISPNS